MNRTRAAFTSIARACTSVEHISLHLVHNLAPGWPPLDFSYIFDGFVKMLEHLPPSASLKKLLITLLIEDAFGIVPPRTVPTADVLKAYDWPGLERVLLAAPCREVMVELGISFVFPVAPKDENQGCFVASMDEQLEFAKDMVKRMPKLSSSGRLNVPFFEMRTQFW